MSLQSERQNSLTSSPVYHPRLKVEECPFDILPPLDLEFDRDSSLEYVGDCPSLSASFLSSDASTTDSQGHRRPSLASSIHSASPEAFWTSSAASTSPTTPMMTEPSMHLLGRQYNKPPSYLANSRPNVQRFRDDEQNSHNSMWNAHDISELQILGNAGEVDISGVSNSSYHLNIPGLSHGNANPSFTQSIFAGSSSALTAADDDMLGLYPSTIHPPADTIEPSVAFQSTLPSSPTYKVEPSTPLHCHIPSSTILSSSPLSMISSRIVPSQHDVDDLPYPLMPQDLGEIKKRRVGTDRLARRAYERKRPVGSLGKSKTTPKKSGMECALVIEQNQFPCSFPECIDKNTGKQKHFKRQEHKKRHENSVHNPKLKPCWVPECNSSFSRTDNLKSHLRNTHSKKPGARGNRYVATLDPNSEFYDPEWIGKLDKHGFPIPS